MTISSMISIIQRNDKEPDSARPEFLSVNDSKIPDTVILSIFFKDGDVITNQRFIVNAHELMKACENGLNK